MRLVGTIVVTLGWVAPVHAEKAGVTVDAAQTVQEISKGSARLIVANAEIFSNDRLRANSSGNAQIELLDGTKVVVGPNADVKIDDFVYSGGSTLGKLTISATRGAFRFISGRSNHSAYSIKTPYATIGVRGTALDVTVSGGGTYVALLNGAMTICDRAGRCRNIDDPCEYIFVGKAGIGAQSRLPETVAQSKGKLFPLLVNQSKLRPQFQRNARGCTANAYAAPVQQAFAPFAAQPVPTPTPAPTPASVGNPGNDKAVGNAGEQPGKGGFGNDGHTGKGHGNGRE